MDYIIVFLIICLQIVFTRGNNNPYASNVVAYLVFFGLGYSLYFFLVFIEGRIVKSRENRVKLLSHILIIVVAVFTFSFILSLLSGIVYIRVLTSNYGTDFFHQTLIQCLLGFAKQTLRNGFIFCLDVVIYLIIKWFIFKVALSNKKSKLK